MDGMGEEGAAVRVLVVDDDEKIIELIRLYLVKDGHQVIPATDGAEALRLFWAEEPDFVILDLGLPGTDGWRVTREIRSRRETPILMLTARGETYDRILGLELGADDYLVKPFDPGELVARMKAIQRRTAAPATGKNRVEYPGLVVDRDSYRVEVEGREIVMPPREIELLYHLASHPDRVFTRDELLRTLWGYEFSGDTRTVDVHVKRLRSRIQVPNARWEIRTVWGVGYKFVRRD